MKSIANLGQSIVPQISKSNFGAASEPHVVSYMSRSERYLLAQLRVGVLPLRIETEGYCNIKLEERICEQCS